MDRGRGWREIVVAKSVQNKREDIFWFGFLFLPACLQLRESCGEVGVFDASRLWVVYFECRAIGILLRLELLESCL